MKILWYTVLLVHCPTLAKKRSNLKHDPLLMKEGFIPGVVPCVTHHGRVMTNPLTIGQAGEGNSNMANNIVDLFAVNPHAAFHINGNTNSYTVHFMLDTGAAVSQLDAKTWDKKIKDNSTLESSGLMGVGETSLRVDGIAKLDLELGGKLYHVKVVVANLRTEAILGLDYLETNRCAIIYAMRQPTNWTLPLS